MMMKYSRATSQTGQLQEKLLYFLIRILKDTISCAMVICLNFLFIIFAMTSYLKFVASEFILCYYHHFIFIGDPITIKHVPPLILDFSLPSNYPSESPPDVTLSCSWLTSEQVYTISYSTLLKMFRIASSS